VLGQRWDASPSSDRRSTKTGLIAAVAPVKQGSLAGALRKVSCWPAKLAFGRPSAVALERAATSASSTPDCAPSLRGRCAGAYVLEPANVASGHPSSQQRISILQRPPRA
jgi:hypothetical protein